MFRRLPLILVILATVALARVGGGEKFDLGSDSGGDGDGAAIAALIRLLLWLIIEYPAVGIPLTIIVVIGFAVHHMRKGDGSTKRAIARAEAERTTYVSADDVQTWVNTLKARDPSFDLRKFLDRVGVEFAAVQEAWFLRNLEPVRRYLSDATYQRLNTQLGLLELQRVRDAIADPRIIEASLLGLEQTESFDTLHVKIVAELRDGEAPSTAGDAEALAIAKRAPIERFIEVWSYVRRPGAHTREDGGVTQGHCPTCGADFSGGASNTCEYCGAIVNSGTHDWVLAEITQGAVFERRHGEPRGFADAHQRDPSLAVEALEDRAALIFWKWIEARTRNDAKGIAKLAAPEFTAGIKHAAFREVAVGAVNTLQLMEQAGREFATFEIRWSADVGTGRTQPLRSVLMLERASNATTNAGQGMSTNRCGSCNAPLTDNGQPTCEYCGATLTSGSRDWVATEMTGWETWLARGGAMIGATEAKAARMPSPEERERLVELLAEVAKADGVVDAREVKMLKWASARWKVPWPTVEKILSAPPNGELKPIAKGDAEGEVLLRALIQMAKADGRVDARERKLINIAAMHLGLSQRVAALLQ